MLAGQNDDTWEHAHGAEEDSRQHHYSLSHQDEVGDDELTFSWEDLPELELKLGRMSWEEEDSDSDDSSMNYWAADETDEPAFFPDDSTQLTAGDDTDQHHSWDISAVSPANEEDRDRAMVLGSGGPSLESGLVLPCTTVAPAGGNRGGSDEPRQETVAVRIPVSFDTPGGQIGIAAPPVRARKLLSRMRRGPCPIHDH